MIVDRAIYRDGRRVAEPQDLAEMALTCRGGGGIAWIGLYRPSREEFAAVTGEFGLHELAVEDAVTAHQRPKLERYGETLFCVLRPARYIDETETVEFGEVHVFAGPGFVITVRHSEAPDLGAVRRGLEARPDLLRRGTVAVVHAVMDRVVDDYAPVVAGVENDIDEIEDDVFDGTADASRRVYDLFREVILFQRAIKPLIPMLEQLSEVSNRQNEEVKKISAWAAILFAPSVVGTIYGMNFDHMPELHWRLGYPYALGLMVLVAVALYVLFKRRRWI
ncbi:MAG: magnesium transporter [Solirubrobacteraceae bacterium]|nr:magnesium transporter [Solirubrobacteraceae bacterium]